MMFRGDQHVDDWAGVRRRLSRRATRPRDQGGGRDAISAGCPDCTARLHRQQSVVRFLQETPLYDPPEDLEYRRHRRVGVPLSRRTAARTPRGPGEALSHTQVVSARFGPGYRPPSPWCALLAAVVGYGIARSGSGPDVRDQLRTGRRRRSRPPAASATTTAPEATSRRAPRPPSTSGRRHQRPPPSLRGPPATDASRSR